MQNITANKNIGKSTSDVIRIAYYFNDQPLFSATLVLLKINYIESAIYNGSALVSGSIEQNPCLRQCIPLVAIKIDTP